MVRTVRRTTALAITRPPGLTHVEARSRTATAALAPARRTTRGPGRMRREGPSQTPMAPQAPGAPTTTRTGASASTVQNSNAYGSSGASTYSKNGNTAYSQHNTNANGTTASMTSSTGAKAYGASGANGNSAAYGRDRKWQQVCGREWEHLLKHRERLEGLEFEHVRNTTHPATPAKAHPRAVQVTAAGEGRIRAAAHRPSIAVVEAGNPGSPVLAAQKAGAVAVGGEVAGERDGPDGRRPG